MFCTALDRRRGPVSSEKVGRVEIRPFLADYVQDPFSEKLLSGAIKDGDTVSVSSGDIGELSFHLNVIQ